MEVVSTREIGIKHRSLYDSAYALEDGRELVGIIHAKDNGPARSWPDQAK